MVAQSFCRALIICLIPPGGFTVTCHGPAQAVVVPNIFITCLTFPQNGSKSSKQALSEMELLSCATFGLSKGLLALYQEHCTNSVNR